MQTKQGAVYAPKSLMIRWTNTQGSGIRTTACLSLNVFEGTMLIDHNTAINLELGGNLANKRSNHSLYG